MSNPFHETEAPGSPSWVHELLTSGFFWSTLILLLHALVATWLGGFEWRLAAWLVFGSHVLSYAWMCFILVVVTGSYASVLSRSRK